MCYSVLQCVAVCCSVLQCVAVCCSVLQCVIVCVRVCACVNEWESEREEQRERTGEGLCHIYICKCEFCSSRSQMQVREFVCVRGFV